MKARGKWQFTTRYLSTLTAIVACALAFSTIPEVWHSLNAFNIGKTAAIVLYAGFWAGVILVDLIERAPDRRFVGFGCVFLAELFAPVLLPATQLGMEPNWPAVGQMVLVAGAASMFLAAGLARLIARRSKRPIPGATGPAMTLTPGPSPGGEGSRP